MDRLTINVAGLLQEPSGTARRLEVEGYLPSWEDISLVTPIEGVIELVRAGKGIVVRSNLDTTIELTCCRCLDAFDEDVHVQFDEMYYPQIDLGTGKAMRPEHDEIEAEFIIENVDRFDLSETIRQHVEISRPLMPRCQPSCLGICAECGADRNLARCDCVADAPDIRMAPIQEMLQQMNQDRPA